jgi:REP element-mobilizing transposase RayT
MTPHKGWYSRDYLPHFDRPGLVQGVTMRLHDSMPQSLLDRWAEELQHLPPNQREAEHYKRLAAYLDSGRGACWLRDARLAGILENTLLHFDDERYRLLAWVIMPNHTHLLVETLPEWPVEKLVQSWKSWSAKRSNEVLGRSGPFWFRDYHDRYIRDGDHFASAKRYIEENPVKAHLCPTPTDWRWSSAWKGRIWERECPESAR